MFKTMLIAGCGGFVGTCCRYLVIRLCADHVVTRFPLATFLVNIIGCFLVGLIYGLIEKTDLLPASATVPLVIGFCGGFTTFSSFANEIWNIGSRGDLLLSIFYMTVSIVVGLLLVWCGRAVVVK
ncbi:MAG: fluoride efflux transporter CrcB [Muribaculaceae bacterium]|nr:fluoride efflux transporter CrcB [Muribaculaceae bacterium]